MSVSYIVKNLISITLVIFISFYLIKNNKFDDIKYQFYFISLIILILILIFRIIFKIIKSNRG